jgi:3-phosphoshikimate 1-carboxyvinyltransferase
MRDPLPISPFRHAAQGAVELPGSKSLTNRALVLAALAAGRTTLTGVLFSRDTEILLRALREIGVEASEDRAARTVEVVGTGGVWPGGEASIAVGNAGTAARFLTALLALHPAGHYRLDGDQAMRQRPMGALLEALAEQGATFTFDGEKDCFPFSLHSCGLRGGRLAIDATASSQFVSALLLAAPYARHPLELEVAGLRPAFVRITLAMMEAFGVRVETVGESVLRVPAGQSPRSPGFYAIEPDVTAASYFLALPLVTGGVISLPGLHAHLLQGDAAFAGVVEALGARVAKLDGQWEVSAARGPHRGLERDFRHFSDTFLTLAAISPLFQGPTVIRGIEHTRRQETDRVAAMATELRETGCVVEETADALRITPDAEALRAAARRGVTIETYEDHRIAMSFAILGCADLLGDGRPWLSIRNPACCGKTFPDFFAKLAALHAASHV